ncbi:MAG: hypothetical protein ABIF71_09940 [Planctomycetota bacterium]
MRAPRAGLLPLYIQLYDEVRPEVRRQFLPFLDAVTRGLTAEGVEVSHAPVCCRASEFKAAVARLEALGVDIIVTIHLAYSPSEESAPALCATRLPILMLDTTMDASFGPTVAPGRLMFNHGIHGVQDLAAVFRRRGRPFTIVAGHWRKSNVLKRAAGIVRAAQAAQAFRSARVLRIGRAFPGMGDFAVKPADLRRDLGITVKEIPPAGLAPHVRRVTAKEVAAEVGLDRRRYAVTASVEAHRRSVRIGLGLRNCLADGGYTAFSMSFLDFNDKRGAVNTVPFLEASKAMAAGIGYAGEGDALTAALVGGLAQGFGRTTFSEIFCPDWQGGDLFLSHMGEVNPAVAARRPDLVEMDYVFSQALNPAYLACAVRPGPALFVNLSPGPRGSYRLIVADVTVKKDTRRKDWHRSVRAWMRPAIPVDEFLERYSRLGGTHHSALVLDGQVESLEAFAQFAGLEFARV